MCERAAGRLTAHRDMGRSHFLDLNDGSARVQLFVSTKELSPEQAELFKLIDLADFIGIEGECFVTKTGEPSLRVKSLTLLSKALRPLPSSWYGLADVEQRYRQRYVDLLANPGSREVFLQRIRIVRGIRDFLHERGFMEVETPMMQAVAGGAAAQPFQTHHNALNIDLFLRIAPELYLKRLLVGGFTKIFELNRNFRNEGISRRHNPEFTMLEAYWAFADFEQMALPGGGTHLPPRGDDLRRAAPGAQGCGGERAPHDRSHPALAARSLPRAGARGGGGGLV